MTSVDEHKHISSGSIKNSRFRRVVSPVSKAIRLNFKFFISTFDNDNCLCACPAIIKCFNVFAIFSSMANLCDLFICMLQQIAVPGDDTFYSISNNIIVEMLTAFAVELVRWIECHFRWMTTTGCKCTIHNAYGGVGGGECGGAQPGQQTHHTAYNTANVIIFAFCVHLALIGNGMTSTTLEVSQVGPYAKAT